MSERKQVDWEAVEREYRAGRGRFPLGEAGAVSVIKLYLDSAGTIERAFGLPQIIRAEQEFGFPRGRADFVFFHADGTASIVEVKDAKSDRDILGGIGQLMSYAVQMGYSRTLKHIRCILVAPTVGADSLLYAQACERAGVMFVPIGAVLEHEIIWAEAAADVMARKKMSGADDETRNG